MERNTSSDNRPVANDELNRSRHPSFRRGRGRLLLLIMLLAAACQRTTVPVITGTRISEVEPAVIEVTATITASQIDECGICYSTTNTSPTPEQNDGIIYGQMDGTTFRVRATLSARTTYYVAVFATNDAGRTVSGSALKFTTSHVIPNQADNPLPNP